MTFDDVLYLLPTGLFITLMVSGVIIAWVRPDLFFRLPGGETKAQLTIWWLRFGGVVMVAIIVWLWIQDWQAVLQD